MSSVSVKESDSPALHTHKKTNIGYLNVKINAHFTFFYHISAADMHVLPFSSCHTVSPLK